MVAVLKVELELEKFVSSSLTQLEFSSSMTGYQVRKHSVVVYNVIGETVRI